MITTDIANKVERQLSQHDQVVLSIYEWNVIIETLREEARRAEARIQPEYTQYTGYRP